MYLAGGTQPATRLIFRILALGAVWGVLVPGVLGVAGLLGWVALPGQAADLLLGGTGTRLVETLALAAGVLAAIVSWQFIVNRRWNLPAWVAGLLALMDGAILQAMLFGLGTAWGVENSPARFLGETAGAVVSMLAVLPVAFRLPALAGFGRPPEKSLDHLRPPGAYHPPRDARPAAVPGGIAPGGLPPERNAARADRGAAPDRPGRRTAIG